MIPTFLLSLSFLCVCIVPFSREQDPAPKVARLYYCLLVQAQSCCFRKEMAETKRSNSERQDRDILEPFDDLLPVELSLAIVSVFFDVIECYI